MTDRTPTTSDILETDIPEATHLAAARLIDGAPFTATALYAMGCALADAGDEIGAQLIQQFAKRFAEHEPATF